MAEEKTNASCCRTLNRIFPRIDILSNSLSSSHIVGFGARSSRLGLIRALFVTATGGAAINCGSLQHHSSATPTTSWTRAGSICSSNLPALYHILAGSISLNHHWSVTEPSSFHCGKHGKPRHSLITREAHRLRPA